MRIIIQAHPARPEGVERLLSVFPQAVIVVDPDPAGQPSPWRCYWECLAAVGERPATIIQDDAVPAPGIHEALDRVRTDMLVSLCTVALDPRHVAAQAAAVDGYATLPPSPWVPLIATVWPPRLAASARAWCPRPGPRPRSDDGMIARWAAYHRVQVLLTAPSLFDHPDDLGSLTAPAHKSGKSSRRAPWVIGDAASWGL